ncbi:export membrane protein SecD [Gleimia coleocanis DSM 15436]|uniref:Protein translocase subunit SecD n=1 Tax=Gleimia coleocanis DSM 15436 TaxID=525245 RepID=C0W1Q0_9ACTO|nr:protein translocase subunit SecD [Gleimia coleocanis]EEH63416.1 export membrane protein SecD [Gleimia coleocanis DSM 15436]
MANKKSNPVKPLVMLTVLIVAAVIALTVGTVRNLTTPVPELALDLQGGTQLILTPTPREGEENVEITENDLSQAIDIIRQRVDASGVAEAEITSQGGRNIVVALPGQPSEETLNLVRSSAVMRFRPLLQAGAPVPLAAQAPAEKKEGEEAAPAKTVEEQAMEAADVDKDGKLSEESAKTPENNSDLAWVTEKALYDYLVTDCTKPESLAHGSTDDPAKPLVACNIDGHEKYLLGPVDVEGTDLKAAVAQMGTNSSGQPTGQWEVGLQFNSAGAEKFKAVSERLFGFRGVDPVRNRFASVLDGNVVTAPSMNSVIAGGQASISGNFTVESARALANQLQFGSLPLNFTVETEEHISATLGSDHLEKGLWAGIIGLALVMLYLLFQYRGLALLAGGSLVMAAVFTYLSIALLSWLMGYRLSLAGVAGLIISVGITADSFIVYFERVRDEVRSGVNLDSAVNDGWVRARRTIIVSDMVNLLAAAVLYFLAVGGVQGFAFTLGLTTIVDLIVILWFTHPIMELLVRTKFFGGGHKLSGLDPEHLGAHDVAAYAGRGRIRTASERKGKSATVTAAEVGRKSLAQQRREAEAELAEATKEEAAK